VILMGLEIVFLVIFWIIILLFVTIVAAWVWVDRLWWCLLFERLIRFFNKTKTEEVVILESARLREIKEKIARTIEYEISEDFGIETSYEDAIKFHINSRYFKDRREYLEELNRKEVKKPILKPQLICDYYFSSLEEKKSYPEMKTEILEIIKDIKERLKKNGEKIETLLEEEMAGRVNYYIERAPRQGVITKKFRQAKERFLEKGKKIPPEFQIEILSNSIPRIRILGNAKENRRMIEEFGVADEYKKIIEALDSKIKDLQSEKTS